MLRCAYVLMNFNQCLYFLKVKDDGIRDFLCDESRERLTELSLNSTSITESAFNLVENGNWQSVLSISLSDIYTYICFFCTFCIFILKICCLYS